jgi:hypothetical protein
MASDHLIEKTKEVFPIPEELQDVSISIILLGDTASQLRAPFHSVATLLMENYIANFDVRIDVIIAVKEKDDELFQYFMKWNDESDNSKARISIVVNSGKRGALLGDAIKMAQGATLVFLTAGFILDRVPLARVLINQLLVPMNFGASMIKGFYGESNPPNGRYGTAGTASLVPYEWPPQDYTSFGGLEEYAYYFPFRYLSTIRIRKSVLAGHLDFLSNIDEALDIAIGAIAIHESIGIATTSIPFVTWMSTPPAPNIEKVRDEVALMKKYFKDMNDFVGQNYFRYFRGVEHDIESSKY